MVKADCICYGDGKKRKKQVAIAPSDTGGGESKSRIGGSRRKRKYKTRKRRRVKRRKTKRVRRKRRKTRRKRK